MDKCPYCGAETRPEDNFCLNCGNRLLSAAASSPQQPAVGEATLAEPDNWGAGVPGASPMGGWSDPSAPTVAASSAGGELPTVRDGGVATAQATLDRIPDPARFILRADNGEILQEYPLDKPEITIGRAPNSDILLSKDKLTSRRHATVTYENNRYLLHDEHSANGTFVNAQQIEDTAPYELQEGDHVGIGEHELIFRAFGTPSNQVEDLPTVAVPQDLTFGTHPDPMATLQSSQENDMFGTEHDVQAEQPYTPASDYAPPVTPAVEIDPAPITPDLVAVEQTSAVPVNTPLAPSVEKTPVGTSISSANLNANKSIDKSDVNITFHRLTNLPAPTLPDVSALVAALAALDGQVNELQDQINATQDAMRNHESEIVQTSNQLRTGVRRVSERMDNTIADVARSREALAWAELLQLMEDVMNNPRDIEYVTKLARKARELNKVFQIHQNVLNTMAECNSLLRSMIGEEK